jgi:ribonuclease PH
MRPPPRLSNCYVPLPRLNTTATVEEFGARRKERILSRRKLPHSSGYDTNPQQQRSTFELRRFRIESNVIQSPSIAGSVLVELGQTKVICTVIGPVTANCPAVPSSFILNMDQGTLHVDVKYIPTTGYPTNHIHVTNSIDATSTAASSQQQQPLHHKQRRDFIQERENDISTRIQNALAAAVPLHPYPKCAILVQFTILYDDGGVIPVCMTAASIALMNAGMEVLDVVTACTVAIIAPPHDGVNDKAALSAAPLLLADPTLDEMSIADCVITIAMLPNWKEITLWEQQPLTHSDGLNRYIPFTITNAAVTLCRDGCRTMHQFIREHMQQQIPKDLVTSV